MVVEEHWKETYTCYPKQTDGISRTHTEERRRGKFNIHKRYGMKYRMETASKETYESLFGEWMVEQW